MPSTTQLQLQLVCAILAISFVQPFNLSPQPNLVIHEPQLTDFVSDHSSYFGFTLNLRANSLIIGAPRANSSLHAIAEPGVIYRCDLGDKSTTQPPCSPFVFEPADSRVGTPDKYVFNGEWRDHQWLGASMDGGPADSDPLVVCAPRMHSHEHIKQRVQEIAPGICYRTTATTGSQPPDVLKINALDQRSNRVWNNGEQYYHQLGQQGMSVHVTDDGEETIVGAPGVLVWRGAVVRVRPAPDEPPGIQSRRRRRAATDEFESVVTNPHHSKIQDDSLFGYAVGSGKHFAGPMVSQNLYVASAPQGNFQEGEVYLFDIRSTENGDQSIDVQQLLYGSQIGEYFGYALAVDDFNGDGWTDVVVGAPFFARQDSFENGAVYVFINAKPKLSLSRRLESKFERNGRFGATLARLGDLDRDGYNDLAVGAPYEDDGVVYIYRGSAQGLAARPAQRLVAPAGGGRPLPGPAMFGHGLSKGADMDGNGYPDVAVGAANAATAYVYRAYPVVALLVRVVPLIQELAIDETALDFRVCWRVASDQQLVQSPKLDIEVKLDTVYGRLTTTDAAARDFIRFRAEARPEEQCRQYRVNVRFVPSYVFKALLLEAQYEVIAEDRVPADSAEFCAHCVAVNPVEPKTQRANVPFSTGCKSTPCVANLKLTSVVKEPLPYIIGSTTSLTIDYAVENFGETAFIPILNVTLPPQLSFSRIPSACHQPPHSANLMLCDLTRNGYPSLGTGHKVGMRVQVDTSRLQPAADMQLAVLGQATSSGQELHPQDARQHLAIALVEFSTVELEGRSDVEFVSLQENQAARRDVQHSVEVRNLGPSVLADAHVVVRVARALLDPVTNRRLVLFDWEASRIECLYKERPIEAVWMFNGSEIHKDEVVVGNVADTEDIDPSVASIIEPARMLRKRSLPATRTPHRAAPTIEDFEELSHLPPARSILFNCDDPRAECVEAHIRLDAFATGDSVLRVNLFLPLDLAVIGGIVDEVHDIFVLQTMAAVRRAGDPLAATTSLVATYPFTVVSKYAMAGVPVWVYIVSAVGGLLILAAIMYGMQRAGFFQRAQKTELADLKRRSQALSLQRED